MSAVLFFARRSDFTNRILWLCLNIFTWLSFAECFVIHKSSFEIQNTQSTITLPEYTTSEVLLRSRPDIKSHEGIYKQCEYFPTPRLRGLCERIAENPIIVAMKDHARGYLKQVPWTTQITKSELPFASQQGLKCPDYSKDIPYISSNLRTLSPWKMVTEFDRLRYPQWIPVAKCMCTGCIDQKTGKENQNFISQEIKVKVRFLRMNSTYSSFRQCTDQTCYPSDEDITVGCHCAIPIS